MYSHATDYDLPSDHHRFLWREMWNWIICVCVSTWTRWGSSFTRTCDISSILRAFRCMTFHQTPSTWTTSMRSIPTRATTRKNSIDSKCLWIIHSLKRSKLINFIRILPPVIFYWRYGNGNAGCLPRYGLDNFCLPLNVVANSLL